MKFWKAYGKKLVVLSVMVCLLVATGVLNWVLSDKLSNKETTDVSTTAQTYFQAYRTDRTTTINRSFLELDAIINSENANQAAKDEANEQKLELTERMNVISQLEGLIKGLGYNECIVTMTESDVNIVVDQDMNDEKFMQIASKVYESVNPDKPDTLKYDYDCIHVLSY